MSEQRKIDFDGLRMVGRAVEEAPDHLGFASACRVLPVPAARGERFDIQAIAARFAITDAQAEALFSGDEWLGNQAKATFLARLRQFILDHEPKPAPAPKPAPVKRRLRPFGGATLHEFTFTIEREDGAGEVNELPLQVTYTHYQGRGAPDDESEATIQFARDAEGKDWYPLLTAEEDMRMQEKAWEHAENQGGNYDEHDPDDRVEHAERFEVCG